MTADKHTGNIKGPLHAAQETNGKRNLRQVQAKRQRKECPTNLTVFGGGFLGKDGDRIAGKGNSTTMTGNDLAVIQQVESKIAEEEGEINLILIIRIWEKYSTRF